MLRLDLNLVWTIINIVVLYLLMKRFLFKPVNEIIAARQKEAEEAFEKAQKTQSEADEAKKTYETSLQDIDKLKSDAVASSRQEAAEEYRKLVSQAQKDADEIIEKAKTSGQVEKDKILKQAQSEITDLVLDAANKISAAKDSPEADRALYDQFIATAGKDRK